MSTKTDPSNFLGTIIGSKVSVKLNNNVQYTGNLQSIDGYMNIVLGDAEEVATISPRKYPDVFIRGNNGMY